MERAGKGNSIRGGHQKGGKIGRYTIHYGMYSAVQFVLYGNCLQYEPCST